MDGLYIQRRELEEGCLYLAVVCDGVGSMADGAYAASESVRALSLWFNALSEIRRAGISLHNEVINLNQKIIKGAADLNIKTACTLSALLIEDGVPNCRYYILHAGDSRIYGLRHEELALLTKDQSHNGRLQNYIGKRRDFVPYYAEGMTKEFDAYLICSDGLYKRMDMDYLRCEVANTSPEKLKRTLRYLTQNVIQSGEKDNISAIVLLNMDTGSRFYEDPAVTGHSRPGLYWSSLKSVVRKICGRV